MKREYAHEPPIVSVTQLNPEQCEVLLHENIVGIDSAIFMHPTIWKASGHVDAFNDPLIDNRDSKKRYPVAGGHRGQHQGQRRRMDRNGPQAGARRAAA